MANVPDSTLDWLGPCLDNAREKADPGAAAITAAMADRERYDLFRFRVLWGALVRHLKQDRGAVRRLLEMEAGAPGRAAKAEARAESDDDSRDTEDQVQDVQLGRWPLGELVVLATTAFDDRRSWAKVVAASPQHPVSFLSLVVARSVQSRTRLGGKGAESPDPVFSERGRQHRVAGMLDHIAEADPECGGRVVAAAGMYRTLLSRIVEHLSEHDGVTTYALRKLFPDHAWPPRADTPRELVAVPLLAAVEARHGVSLSPQLAAELARLWEVAVAPPVPREGLEVSAAYHERLEGFPGWPEVALWSGHAAPGAGFNANTLQRHVSRIDEDVSPFVTRQHDRLRRILEP